jgi:DNA invertase Pin-like site-specific DNA recombinase
MPVAAIYARVSSDKQREESTIASQTAALITFARSRGYQVPTEWIFEDEGYSGASLVRPGLERVRDLAAEGQIEAVLVHAPDRLSRKYAYQVLLVEELARHGVDTVFMKAPRAATAEDQLLVQFQGMIAEYERAQILERSRRGKRHWARQGQVNVLSGAPYGYRYVRKSDDAAARYEIINAEAEIVRTVYDRYVIAGMSIGAITRLLNERGVPTRKRISRWERSTVWAMLRNPAYKGTHASGRPRLRHANASRARYACAAASARAAAPTTNDLVPTGSRLRSPPSLMRIPSREPRNCWSKTRSSHRVARSHPALCKAWCRAANAAMRCHARRRAQVPATFTTTDASVPTLGDASAAQCAITAPSARISSTRSSGPRSSACWRIPA